LVGQELSKSLGQSVIGKTRTAQGLPCANYVAKAKPDGHTLLMSAVHHTIATRVYKKLGYNFQKDFALVTTVALVPNVPPRHLILVNFRCHRDSKIMFV
jgi:tripartite-type tricarboxylate transporter receptor subunit TctC